jgi:four helix bundle protein
MPRQSYTGIRGQITDAAESVALTIVEGAAAASQREFARFLDMSIKSSRELEAQLVLLRGYGVLGHALHETLTNDNISLRKQICSLRTKVLCSADAEDAQRHEQKRKRRTS